MNFKSIIEFFCYLPKVPDMYAVAEQAESATWLSIQKVWDKNIK